MERKPQGQDAAAVAGKTSGARSDARKNAGNRPSSTLQCPRIQNGIKQMAAAIPRRTPPHTFINPPLNLHHVPPNRNTPRPQRRVVCQQCTTVPVSCPIRLYYVRYSYRIRRRAPCTMAQPTNVSAHWERRRPACNMTTKSRSPGPKPETARALAPNRAPRFVV